MRDVIFDFHSLMNGSAQPKSKFPKLRRTALTHLHDVKIVCADEKELYAHKCILVARLEYFSLMFSNSWSETKTVNLCTVPLEYMLPLVEFLYAHDAEAFKKQKPSENFLYNMIVICDQFFVNRLRRVCEKLVLERVSTRKCGEMLEFACAYNCEELEKGCLQFICQNLARVLEQKSLEGCDPSVLAKVNSYYREVYKYKLDYRIITPNSEAVPDDDLEKFITDFTVDLEYKLEEADVKSKAKNKAKVNKSAISKRSYEIEAIQSMKELSVDEKPLGKRKDTNRISESENEVEKQLHAEAKTWMKVSTSDNRKKFLLAAIKTNEILKEEAKTKEAKATNFTPITKAVVKPQSKPEEITTINRTNLNFGDFTPLKGEKLSQKQRKRLSFESKTESVPNTTTKPIPIPQQPNAWGIVQSPVSNEQSSFADIMRSPSTTPKFEPSSSSSPDKLQTSHSRSSILTSTPNASRNLSFASIAESSPTTSRRSDNSFSKILEGERKQKEYYDRMKSKSLVLTQIEETAIAELEAFYNVDNVFDEDIRVARKRHEHTMNFAVWQHN